MTYFQFLLIFLVLPILCLLSACLLNRRRPAAVFQSGPSLAILIAIHVALALLYTTPWDNYLVATGVWYYDPALVSGLLLGWVPVEEYTFFVLESVFVGLWWWLLVQRLPPPAEFEPRPRLRLWVSALLAILWFASLAAFFSGWKPGTYLSITLLWALPPILLQVAFGADILWRHRRLVSAAILPMALYLSLVDSLAIASGTWTVAPAQSTGLLIGRLPLEEIVFFFLTVTLLTFGMTLAKAAESGRRLSAWNRPGLPAGSAPAPRPE